MRLRIVGHRCSPETGHLDSTAHLNRIAGRQGQVQKPSASVCYDSLMLGLSVVVGNTAHELAAGLSAVVCCSTGKGKCHSVIRPTRGSATWVGYTALDHILENRQQNLLFLRVKGTDVELAGRIVVQCGCVVGHAKSPRSAELRTAAQLHIPDPTGVGSVKPVLAGAAVTPDK